MDRYNFLSSFHPISKDESEEMLSLLRERSFKKGEHIITPGQVQKQIYFVKSGVQMCHVDKDDKMHVMAFTYPPNLCALPDSFFEQKPSKFHYTCVTDSDVEFLPYTDLQKLFSKSRNIETLFRRINEKLLAGVLNIHVEFR